MLPLHCLADTLDRLASLPACLTNSGLNLPHGLVDLTLTLQIAVVCQIANSLLGVAFRLIDLPVALILIPQVHTPIVVHRPQALTLTQHSMRQSCHEVCAFENTRISPLRTTVTDSTARIGDKRGGVRSWREQLRTCWRTA